MPTNLELERQLKELEVRVDFLERHHYHGIGTMGSGMNHTDLPITIKNGQFRPVKER